MLTQVTIASLLHDIGHVVGMEAGKLSCLAIILHWTQLKPTANTPDA